MNIQSFSSALPNQSAFIDTIAFYFLGMLPTV